jgi:hypothetical protein
VYQKVSVFGIKVLGVSVFKVKVCQGVIMSRFIDIRVCTSPMVNVIEGYGMSGI